jgi:hypothetical protein
MSDVFGMRLVRQFDEFSPKAVDLMHGLCLLLGYCDEKVSTLYL